MYHSQDDKIIPPYHTKHDKTRHTRKSYTLHQTQRSQIAILIDIVMHGDVFVCVAVRGGGGRGGEDKRLNTTQYTIQLYFTTLAYASHTQQKLVSRWGVGKPSDETRRKIWII